MTTEPPLNSNNAADISGLARTARLLFLGSQIDGDDEGEARALLGFDCVSVELRFVSQHAHSGIDVVRISLANAALQLQIHFFAASRIFLAEHFDIDRRLLVYRLVIGLENRTFAEAVAPLSFAL